MTETRDPGFLERLKELIGEEKPYAWAARIGIPSGAFKRMYNDGIMPKYPYLQLIADKTGCRIEWLGAGRGPKEAPVLRESSCLEWNARRNENGSSVVPLEDAPLEQIKQWVEDFWREADPDYRIWFKIEFRKRWPEFVEWLQKKERGCYHPDNNSSKAG